MANGNGASGDPFTCDAVQAVRAVDRGESCAKSGRVHTKAKPKTHPTILVLVRVRSLERTRQVMRSSPVKKKSNRTVQSRDAADSQPSCQFVSLNPLFRAFGFCLKTNATLFSVVLLFGSRRRPIVVNEWHYDNGGKIRRKLEFFH